MNMADAMAELSHGLHIIIGPADTVVTEIKGHAKRSGERESHSAMRKSSAIPTVKGWGSLENAPLWGLRIDGLAEEINQARKQLLLALLVGQPFGRTPSQTRTSLDPSERA